MLTSEPEDIDRTPSRIIFVLDTDYTDRECSVPDVYRGQMLMAIEQVMEYASLEKFDVIASDDPQYLQHLKEMNIPELWMHDALNGEVGTYSDYYIMEYNDGSRKLYVMKPPTDEEDLVLANPDTRPIPDVMFG